MNYAVYLLKKWLENFNHVYDELVINGDISPDSNQAKINRSHANDLENAINKLEKNEN